MKGIFIRLHRSLSTPQVEEQLILNDLPKNNVAKDKFVIVMTIFSNGLEMNKKDIQSRY
jgi:hypothetical protein